MPSRSTQPDQWTSPEGVQWKQPAEADHLNLQLINEALTESISRHLCSQASQHRFGAGLEKGFYAKQFSKHLNKLGVEEDVKPRGLILATATAVFRKIGEVARKRRLSNAVRLWKCHSSWMKTAVWTNAFQTYGRIVDTWMHVVIKFHRASLEARKHTDESLFFFT